MNKIKILGITLLLTLIIVILLIFSYIGLTWLIASSETPEQSLDNKVVKIEPGGEYSYGFSNVRSGRLIEWHWKISEFKNDSIKFWIQDGKGDIIYYFSSDSNQTSDDGRLYFNYRDDYTIIWENGDQNRSTDVSIKQLVIWDSEGFYEPMLLVYIFVPILFMTYIIFLKKYPKKYNQKKGRSSKYGRILLIIIAFIIFYLIIINVFIPVNNPASNENLILNPNDYHREKYPELYKDLDVPVKWTIDGNATINFWIENENGYRYKKIDTSDNLTYQRFRFIPPDNGDYWLVFENPSNEMVSVHYLNDPNPKDNTSDLLRLLSGLILTIIIFMNIYAMLIRREIKYIV
jgi:amino acid transporter